ncbi:pirin family protein [Pseudoxanthomonas sp.]|uniref:pirin family protein n=1 Tax=Pseudoxanthomonas sp. TaxID=1871049 RepID=UPI00260DDE71|nr:pirin family protein [Pseudoxanthomonas sp.]WDS36502.1 MAG: pirin family protein [Pseudoxanthomonas sp.]
MFDITQANTRGVANHGWLKSRHTFSFGSYFNPNQVGFSDLRVINDDRVDAGEGFGAHPHRDMEIFSYVLEGALAHKDSMGTGSVIRPGDVQMMSAGSGVSHSEFNGSQDEAVHFLQIWIVPNERNAEPRYQERNFSDAEKRGQLRLIISPDGAQESLQVRQDVRVYAGLFDGDATATFDMAAQRYAYVHVARGEVELNGKLLREGDGVRVRESQALTFANGKDSEVLLFDLRPFELPGMQ